MERRELGVEAVAAKSPDLESSIAEGTDLSPTELIAMEAELRRALRPIELPAGFADRLVARAAAVSVVPPQRGKVLPFRSWRLAAGGAIAASLLAGSLLVEQVHQRQARQHAAAVANQQFETATRITEETLERTREQLRRAGVSAIE